jgi:hypothetical protein
MSSPVLALTPVPTSSGTGAGATARTARHLRHYHHPLGENTDPGPGPRAGPPRGRA